MCPLGYNLDCFVRSSVSSEDQALWQSSQFYAIMEDQMKVFLSLPRKKMLIGQGRWEVLRYEIVFALSYSLSGNGRD